MIRKIRTIYDARNEKRAADARLLERDYAAEARAIEVRRLLDAHPYIGQLVRKGRTVFYMHISGKCVEADRPEALIEQARE